MLEIRAVPIKNPYGVHYSTQWCILPIFCPVYFSNTVFPRIVSAETILLWIWAYVHKTAETIQGRKLFNRGNYSREEIRYPFSCIQGPVKIWMEHFTKSHFLKLQLWEDLERTQGARIFWTINFNNRISSHLDFFNEGSNFVVNSLEIDHWVAQTWPLFWRIQILTFLIFSCVKSLLITIILGRYSEYQI